jgi:hypothetical protein
MSDLNIPESAVADYHRYQNEIGQPPREPSDDEFFEWCFKVPSSTEVAERVYENINSITLGAVFAMLCEPRKTQGLICESDARDIICASTLRGQIKPILKKYFWDDCIEWIANGGKL